MQDYIFLELLVTHFLPHVSHTKGSELTQFSSKRENEVYNAIKSAKKKAKVAIVAAKKKKVICIHTHTQIQVTQTRKSLPKVLWSNFSTYMPWIQHCNFFLYRMDIYRLEVGTKLFYSFTHSLNIITPCTFHRC